MASSGDIGVGAGADMVLGGYRAENVDGECAEVRVDGVRCCGCGVGIAGWYHTMGLGTVVEALLEGGLIWDGI